jgi:hypothetical protein
MHASGRGAGFTYGILAVVFIATALCLFAVLAWVMPRTTRPPPVVFGSAASAPAAHRRKLTHLASHEGAEAEPQLSPVTVRCKISEAFSLGAPGEITLTLEAGQHGVAADPENPRPCSAEPQTVKVATNVSAFLQGPPDVVKFAPAEEKRYSVTPAGPINWTWYVTPLQPGTFNAQIVLSTELKIGGKDEPIQIWAPAQPIAVQTGFLDRIGYVIDWMGNKPLVTSLLGGLLAALGTAIIGTLGGWFNFLFHRKARESAETRA